MDDKSWPHFKKKIVSVGFISAKRVIATNWKHKYVCVWAGVCMHVCVDIYCMYGYDYVWYVYVVYL